MVQGRIRLIIAQIGLRIALLIAAFYIGAITSSYALSFMEDSLGYYRPSGFFGFTLEHLFAPWIFASIFWVSTLLGSLGKKVDYLTIGVITLLALLSFYGFSLEIYVGLLGIAALGNALGYALKLARQRWLRK